MQEELGQKAVECVVNKRRKKLWKKVVAVLASTVVFCTTYALILPAITMDDNSAYCGIEAHKHGEECYEKTLTCAQEESSEIHTHTEACIASEKQLTCTIEEAEHEHTDECYVVTETYICGHEEGEEIPGHVHTDECYELVLKCEKEEHEHELSCYSDPEADLETPEQWEQSVAEVELTGDWHRDVIAIAESQIGYHESEKNIAIDDDGSTRGYTRYGAWYGDPYGDWCAMFVSFCLHYANIPAEAFPIEESCPRWVEALQPQKTEETEENPNFFRTREDYIPQPGDLMFLDIDGDQLADHVGLIAELIEPTETEPAKIRMIEGNSSDCVQSVEYAWDDEQILGYAELPVEPHVEYRWSQGGLEVTASVRQDESLPENAKLVVQPINPEEAQSSYNEKYEAALADLDAEKEETIGSFDLFKVYLEADGQEILPEEDAKVEIRLLAEEYPMLARTEMIHYLAEDADKAALQMQEETGNLSGSFEAKLSSEYAVVGVQNPEEFAVMPYAEGVTGQETTPLQYHKTIDAFRDGEDNPDTTLDDGNIDKTDLYRIYLDAEVDPIKNPIDLLIIVDQSGSMHMNYYGYDETEIYPDDNENCTRDMTKENGTSAFRDEAVRLILNGTSKGRKDGDAAKEAYAANLQNGLIYQFLAANSDNKVAVVGFQGYWDYGSKFRYNTNSIENPSSDTVADTEGHLDAQTLLEWTSSVPAEYVNIEGKQANSTNYCAGLLQAKKMLQEVADDGHQKVILFLSDGEPTAHIGTGQERVWVGGSIFNPIYEYETYYYRDGQSPSKGITLDTTNLNKYFTDLVGVVENPIVHAISICSDDAGSVLGNMVKDYGECHTVKKGENATNDLRAKLKKLMVGTTYYHLVIEDTLSDYVDLCEQPDFKVTRKEADGITVTPLYENGVVTDAGKGVIKSVDWDPKSGKVTANFEENYTAEPGTIVTLSFNVKTNQTAYREYAQSGYPKDVNGNTVVGDLNTDYGDNNKTSAGEQGFRSNDLATVKYTKEEVGKDKITETKEYPHPVVQAATCKMVLQKTDRENTSQKLPGAEFTLYRKAGEGETGGESIAGLPVSDKYIKLQEKITTAGENGQVVIEGLIAGDYCLVETKAPDGYRKLEAPVTFTLTRGTNGQGQITGSTETITVVETTTIDGENLPLLEVSNQPFGHELPHTGGIGTTWYTIGGVLMMMAAGISLLYIKKKRGKEDFVSS